MPPRLLLSFGDRSADNILSRILPILKSRGVEIYGLKGEKTAPFVNPLGDISDIEATGLVEVIPKIPKVLKTERKLLEFAEREKPDAVLLVDAPGFNLRLLKKLKNLGVKNVIYFILPQFWAWKEGRKEILRRFADTLVSILPFEKKYFENYPEVEFHYVGHPSVEILKQTLEESKIPPKPLEDYFVIFPGSRENEIKRHLKVLTEAVPRAVEEFNVRPVLLTFKRFKKVLKPLRRLSKVVYLDENPALGYLYIKEARFGWIKSGTTAFETALLGTPHLLFYRVNPITYFVGKKLVKTPWLHLANITLEEEVVPELIQNRFNPKELIRTTYEILEKEELQREKFEMLKETLKGQRDTFSEVANLVLEKLKG